MGIKERRGRDKAATRQLILDSARDLLVEEGYEALTMRRLADRIEYSPTAIYVHFADKESLLTELSVCDFLVFTSTFDLVPRHLPPLDRLRALGLAYVRFAAEHAAQYRHLFMTPRELDPAAQAAKPDEDAYDLLVATVDAAVASGDIHPGWKEHRHHAAQVLWTALHGIVALDMTMPRGTRVPLLSVAELASTAMDVCVAGLKLPPRVP